MERKPATAYPQIIKNVLMNWLAFFVTIGTGFFVSPFLIHHLGDSVYGVWVLVGSLVGYLGLLDFGITSATVKYVAEYRARGDQEAMNRAVTGGLAVYSIMGVAALAISICAAFTFNRFFHSPLSNQLAAAVVMLAGVNIAVTLPAGVFVGLIRGYQRYDIDSTVTTAAIVLRTALLVALIARGDGILALSLVAFGFDMLRLAVLVRIALRLNPELRLARRYMDWPELRRMFGYSVYVFFIVIGKRLLFMTDEIVVGLFMTTSAVTVYFIAGRLVTYLRQLITEMMGVLMPATSDLDARDDRDAIRRMLGLSTKYMLLIALPVGAVFLVLGDIFIGLWVGPGYAASATVLTILTIAMLAHFLDMASHTFLLGLGSHRIIAGLTGVQAVLNLGLSVLLVRPYGLAGVALGTAIPMVGLSILSLIVYFKSYLKFPLGDYLQHSVLPPFAIQLPFAGLLLLIRLYVAPASIPAFFAAIGVALAPYVGLALLTCVSPPERRAFLRMAERRGLKVAVRPL